MAGIIQSNNLNQKQKLPPRRNQPLISSLLLNRDISRSALLQQEDLDICVASMELLMFRSIYLLEQVSTYPRKHILDLWHRVVSGSIGNRLLYRGTPLTIPDVEAILEEEEVENGDGEDSGDEVILEESPDDEKKKTSSEVWKRYAEERFMSYGAVLLKASLIPQDPLDFIRLLRSLNLSREMYTQVVIDALEVAKDDKYGDYCNLVEKASALNCRQDLTDSELTESIDINQRMYTIEQALGANPSCLYGVIKSIKSYYKQHQALAETISTAYLRLVVKNAQQRKIAGESQSPDDDRQNGVFGLIRAIRMYDHRTGARFATYAGYWIRQAIRFHAKLQINMIRQPKSLWDSYNKVEKARRTLEKGRSEEASQISNEDLSDETGFSLKQIEKIYTRVKTAQVRSLDFSMEGTEASEAFTLKDVTPLDGQNETDDLSSKVLTRISQLLLRLPEEESRVVALKFGLLDHLIGDDMDLKSIAKERIRQLVATNLLQEETL